MSLRRSANPDYQQLKKYKSGLNILDELNIINDRLLNKKINTLIVNFLNKIHSISDNKHSHYFMTLLLHDTKNVINSAEYKNMNTYLKNCLCSYCTSIYRDVLRDNFNLNK